MPRLASIDRQFRRFLRTGDARALGKVFDGAAPELLKIAAHLAGNRQHAEDLVQSTFLVAIERRSEFDANRSVMPWLCGIVANLARAERRRDRRPAAASKSFAASDPSVDASTTEFRQAFADARAGLTELYRPVLELHLEHGLTAQEIARVLNRPAGTIRAQISRGLEMLRKRIPRGFLAGGAVALAGPLHAMRTAVLAHAESTITTSTPHAIATGAATTPLAASIIIGGALQKKLIVACVAVACFATLVTWQLWGPPQNAPAPAGSGGAAAARSNGELFGNETMQAASRYEATPVEPIADRTAAATEAAAHGPEVGSIRVTARWEEGTTPAANLSIEALHSQQPFPVLQPQRALTDSSGRCLLENVPIGQAAIFASTGDVAKTTVAAGKVAEVTLLLHAWGAVHGVVIDHNDQPVADADVWVSSEVQYRSDSASGHGQHGAFTLRTDAAGRFATRLNHGQCLAAFKAGHGPSLTVYPCSGVAPAEGAKVTLQLAAEGSALTVEVRSKSGQPIANAQVLVGQETPNLVRPPRLATTPASRTTTNERGLAEFGTLPAKKLPVQVRAAGFAPWQGEHQLPPSATTNMTVYLEPAAAVYGVVVDTNGTPLAGALVQHGKGARLASSSCLSDATGKFALSGLPPGQLDLRASKRGVGECRLQLDVDAGASVEWQPELTLRPAITGVVHDVAGKPVAGAYVACSGAARPRMHRTTTSGSDGRFTLGPLRTGDVYQVVAEYRSDSIGVQRIIERGIAPESDLVLRGSKQTAPTARLRGRLLEPDGQPATQVTLTMKPAEANESFPVSIDVGGHFVAGPSKPGRVRITARRNGKMIADLGEHLLRAQTTIELGDIHLPTPGGAVVRITGGNAIHGVLSLFREGQFHDDRRLEQMEVTWSTLPPGNYLASVRSGGAAPLLGATTFVITGGNTARIDLPLQAAHRCEVAFVTKPQCRRHGTLVVVDASGGVVLRHSVELSIDGKPTRILLPAGKLQLHFRSGNGWLGQATATAPSASPIRMTLSPPR